MNHELTIIRLLLHPDFQHVHLFTYAEFILHNFRPDFRPDRRLVVQNCQQLPKIGGNSVLVHMSQVTFIYKAHLTLIVSKQLYSIT